MNVVSKGSREEGFTLIEILVVIGMVALLATIVLVAINPARQFAQGRNTQRTSNVTAILNAIGQYTAENKGVLPTAITTTAGTIGNTGIDLCAAIMPTYIPSLPQDPSLSGGPFTTCTTYNTGYQVVKDANGRVTVSAPSAELGVTIAVTR